MGYGGCVLAALRHHRSPGQPSSPCGASLGLFLSPRSGGRRTFSPGEGWIRAPLLCIHHGSPGTGGGREPPGTHSECRTGATRSPSESRPRADPGPAGGRVSPDPGLSTPGTSTPGTSTPGSSEVRSLSPLGHNCGPIARQPEPSRRGAPRRRRSSRPRRRAGPPSGRRTWQLPSIRNPGTPAQGESSRPRAVSADPGPGPGRVSPNPGPTPGRHSPP